MEKADLNVRSGAVIALRLFDIAYSIDLDRVESLWSARTEGTAVRSSLASTPAKALSFDVPPILLHLDPLTLKVAGRTLGCQVTARIYDFGVSSIAVRVPVSEMTWEEYCAFCNEVDHEIGPTAEEPWQGLLKHLCAALAPAMNRPNRNLIAEDHLIALVQEWNKPVTGSDLPGLVDLIPLLSGENRPLSGKSREDLLKQRFSYYRDDLVVVTWDRAFIYEPRNESDIADIIEVANAQLLEFRYYDELLNEELPRMYETVRMGRRKTNLLASRRFANLARKLYTLVAEVTELTEKAENVLRVTEDVYLARIYAASLEILRVPTVSASVERKLAIVRDTYAALFAEASGARAELLEAAIVLLIILEIAIMLLRRTA
jgi:hypothetical protein